MDPRFSSKAKLELFDYIVLGPSWDFVKEQAIAWNGALDHSQMLKQVST